MANKHHIDTQNIIPAQTSPPTITIGDASNRFKSLNIIDIIDFEGSFSLEDDGTPRFSIDGSGNIGIGTLPTGSSLAVHGNSVMYEAKLTDTQGNFLVFNDSTDTTLFNMYRLGTGFYAFTVNSVASFNSDFSYIERLNVGNSEAPAVGYSLESPGSMLMSNTGIPADDGVLNSAQITFRGEYDSDIGSPAVTALVDFDIDLAAFVTGAGPSPKGYLGFTIDGIQGPVFDESGQVGMGGITDPSAGLHIQGTGNTSGTKALRVDSLSSLDSVFVVQDDGKVGINVETPLTTLHVNTLVGVGVLVDAPAGNNINYLLTRNAADATVHNMWINGAGVGKFNMTGLEFSSDGKNGINSLVVGSIGVGPSAGFSFENRGATLISNSQSVIDEGVVNSQKLVFRGEYDSNDGSPPALVGANFDVELKVFVTGAGPSPTGYLGFTVDGTQGPVFGESGQVGIGTSSPAADSKLDITSTTGGLLPPRVSTAQRDLIGIGSPLVPTEGLLVYNSDTNDIEFYNGTSWNGTSGGLDGNGIYGGSGTVPSATVVTLTDKINFVGNVGIGATAPAAKLDVNGTVSGVVAQFKSSTGSTPFLRVEVGASSRPVLYGKSTSAGLGMGFQHAFDTGDDVLTVDQSSFHFAAYKNDSFAALENANIMTITNAGHVNWVMDADGNILQNVASSGSVGQPKEGFDFVGGPSVANFLIRRNDALADDIALDSPKLIIRGTYDSDDGSPPGITSADFDSTFQTIVDTAGASPAGRLAISVEGSEYVSITEIGNVGIGIAAPVSKLHVQGSGDSSFTKAFRVDSASTLDNILTVRDDGRVGINSSTTFDYALNVIGNTTTNSQFLAKFRRSETGTGHIILSSVSSGDMLPWIEGESDLDGQGVNLVGRAPVGGDLPVGGADAVVRIRAYVGVNDEILTGNIFSVSNRSNPVHIMGGSNAGGGNLNSMAWNAATGLSNPIHSILGDRAYTFLSAQYHTFGIRSLQHGGNNGFVASPIFSLIGLHDDDGGAGQNTAEFETTFQSVPSSNISDGGSPPVNIADGYMQIRVDGGDPFILRKNGNVSFGGAAGATRFHIEAKEGLGTEPIMQMYHETAGANNQSAIAFSLRNAANQETRFAMIGGRNTVTGTGIEYGTLDFQLVNYGTLGTEATLTIDQSDNQSQFNVDKLALGTTSIPGDAIIDITSTTQGFLPPRMGEAQRDLVGIGSPPIPSTGMVVYNSTSNKLNLYNGTSWVEMESSAGGGVNKYSETIDNTGSPTPIQPDVAETITHSLGTTDIMVQIWDLDSGEMTSAKINNRTSTTVDITFSSVPPGDIRVVVMG